jgi:GNAT superfamily N-acetyltransferase
VDLDNDEMIGFISLFKYDGDECRELTPWYATMYVKKEYRGNGYSKILNDELLRQTKEMGYDKLYLKSELENYYEKFGAKYIKMLENGEKLYYIDL